MNESGYLHPECIRVGIDARDKADVLHQIADVAVASPVCAALTAQAIYDGLRQREDVTPTAIGHGVAVPHARLAEIDDFIVGLLTLAEGVDFGTADGQPVRIVFFILGPLERHEEHLRLLATMSRTAASVGTREGLLAATSMDQVQALLGDHLVRLPSSRATTRRSLLTIWVQHEQLFFDVLQMLSSVTPSISVTEGHDAAHYLHSLPLYASLWVEEEPPLHRQISAAVDWRLVDELVDEIDGLAQQAGVEDGILVTVQPLTFSMGDLRP